MVTPSQGSDRRAPTRTVILSRSRGRWPRRRSPSQSSTDDTTPSPSPPPVRRSPGRHAHRRTERRDSTPRPHRSKTPSCCHHLDERQRQGRHRRRSSSPRQTAVEAVHLIVAAADGKGNQRKKGISAKYLFPFDLVERGNEGKAIKKGEASWEEYTLGLETQPGFPSSAVNALLRHREMVVQDNCSLAGATIRHYLEEIFPQWQTAASHAVGEMRTPLMRCGLR